jgi:uncharacterized protein (TIGR03435 family)
MHGVDRMIRTAFGLLTGVCVLFGQTEAPQAFEVASIKSSKLSGEGSRRERIEATPGSLIMANVRFATAMRWAYHVQDVQINGPGWINDERFDIVAKAATPAPESALRLMLQSLLADRFKLSLHRQTREMTAYVVVVAKEGHKLKESVTEGPPSYTPKGVMGAVAERADLDEMMAMASQLLHTPIVNLTGLKGRYDFSLDFSEYLPELAAKRESPMTPEDLIPIAASAMQKQLGLKLESRKTPVEILVIDRVDKIPAEN